MSLTTLSCAVGHALNAAAGYVIIISVYSVIWALDRFYQLAGRLDSEQNGRHWDY